MSLSLPRPVMWDAAFDYVRLTATGELGNEDTLELYRKVGLLGVAGEEGQGVLAEPWAWRGYLGTDYGVVQVGAGTQGCILQASGWAAAAIREAAPPYTGVPRVDLQVTVWYDQDPGGLVKRYADRSSAAAKCRGAAGWGVSHICGYGDGDTAYLGSRLSDVFVRIYDKGRQSGQKGGYENALRYEVEVKGSLGSRLWAGEALQAPDRHWVASQVLATLRARHVFLALPDALPAPPVSLREKPETNTASRLAWMRNQVAPAICKLKAAGVEWRDIADALGIGGD